MLAAILGTKEKEVEKETDMMRIRPESRDTKEALIEVMKSSVPMIVLTTSAMKALTDAPSSPEAAAKWLVRLAAKYEKPVGINTDNRTAFIGPPRWSSGRLKGYVAAHVTELETVFGPVKNMESSIGSKEIIGGGGHVAQ